MVTEDITQDDLLAEVAAWVDRNAAAHERPGTDWFTTREIADRSGRTLDQTRRWLNDGVSKGLYEKRTYGRSFAYYRKCH
jgi:predicted transcriptional regulator